MDTITVYIAQDDPGILTCMEGLLETTGNMVIVGISIDGTDVAEKVAALQPDIVIMDIMMPTVNGIEATRMIRDRGLNTHVLMFSSLESDETVLEAFFAGAAGFLIKGEDCKTLPKAVEAIVNDRVDFWLADRVRSRWMPILADRMK